MKIWREAKSKIANKWDDLAIWWAELSPAKREIWRWSGVCVGCFFLGGYVL